MFLPVNIDEMRSLGWECLDIILISGDAYIDHPSFGAAIIGKYLVSKGFKVGIIAQPDTLSNTDFQKLPAPRLFVGISSGNVDSMVNNYTASKKPRRSDDYSEGGAGGKRPDRAVIVYANKAKENFKGVPVVIGGIEASLRRVAHYDYWSDKVRRSILADSKADILVFGQGERTILKIAQELKAGKSAGQLRDLRGTAFIAGKTENLTDKYKYEQLPSFEEVISDKEMFIKAEKVIHSVTNPFLDTGLVQETNGRQIVINPPVLPDDHLDEFYDLEFENKPHPMYKEPIPAYEMIRNSITIHRGCFGGCSFCSIAQHQGSFIQSRSEASIVKDAMKLKSKSVTDLGGPSANMYRMRGRDLEKCMKCVRLSCLFPKLCPNLDTSHKKLIKLYDTVKEHKRVFINSGIRHELALLDKEYMRAVAGEFTSGLLKIAPEHTEADILRLMLKPDIIRYEEFVKLFRQYSKKEQYVLPYLISAFPGATLDTAKKMSAYLKIYNIKVEQVQDFIPLPMTIAACMYYTEKNFFTGEKIYVAKSYKEREEHRKLMQWWKK
ncbi:TPA: YgiQ family radical SAM protein [Candidatus Delongbacteria bacterium]|nr:MAG: YgiQ family radical SAM protein [Candidatus Delongbacteria bacterium GWF2_40_14]HAQ62272.1 YgiQ family radical SAM protein [Candidatus Delongbacteria bacterium]